MKTKYMHIKYFEKEKNKAKYKEEDFEIVRTTYMRTIKKTNETIIFNQEGNTDDKDLILINSVRQDGKKFNEQLIKPLNTKKEKVDFFDLVGVIDSKEVIKKVDIRSAYWELALKEKIITLETDNKFKKLFDGYDSSAAKQSRLRALGSLATVKHTQKFKKGLMYDEDVKRELTRDLYLHICAGVDRVMRDVINEIGGCRYYYWDCIFVSDKFEADAVQYLKEKGYHTSSQETRLEYVKIGNTGYLVSTLDDKVYMTRKENASLLENEEEDLIELDNYY